MLKVGGGANINMISNAVTKPNFELNFEALVKADRIDEGTLPEVKKFVQQEINNLVKQMNYALRVKGAR
jgi:phosphotransferase system IIB component